MGITNLLNKEEKAAELKISVVTLDRRRKKGEIEGIKVRGNKKQIWFLPEEKKITDYDKERTK
jgi:predicted site-specific integrase-resolvase